MSKKRAAPAMSHPCDAAYYSKGISLAGLGLPAEGGSYGIFTDDSG